MNLEYFTLAFNNIRRRKLRSWLTIFGIVISIATIFILVSVSLGLSSSVQEQFRQLGTDKFFILPKGQLGAPGSNNGAVTLTTDDIREIKRISGIKSVSSISLSGVKLQYASQTRFASLIGVDDDSLSIFFESGFVKVDEGRFLSKGSTKNIMVGSSYKSGNVFSKPLTLGSTLDVNNASFKIKTILQPVGNPQDDRQLYILMTDFDNLFPQKKNTADEIIVQVDAGYDLKVIADKVEKQLINSRGVTKKTEDFTIQTPEELLATFGTILNILTAFLLGIAAISLLVGGIGITNTMYTAVLERTREIGVMKAVGARNRDITYIFTIESGFIGLIGGIFGVILGTIIAKSIEFIVVKGFGFGIFGASTPFYLFAGSLIFSFGIGVVSGIIPAHQASKIRPVEALRYE